MPQPALAATSTIRTESDVCLVAAYPALPLPETLGEATALSPATTPAPLLRRWRIGDLADSVCSALRWRPASWWPHYAEWLAKYSGDKSATQTLATSGRSQTSSVSRRGAGQQVSAISRPAWPYVQGSRQTDLTLDRLLDALQTTNRCLTRSPVRSFPQVRNICGS